jgi:predicted Zn-dependent protease
MGPPLRWVSRIPDIVQSVRSGIRQGGCPSNITRVLNGRRSRCRRQAGSSIRFRAKYGIDIQARHPLALPEHSRVAERGQVDSTVLLETLAKQYPETPTRTVVIGLTTADIFIPGLEWRYAFSNRRAPRLAVVSPARMDRGCMGIRPAHQDTQMARLRKMVGFLTRSAPSLFKELAPLTRAGFRDDERNG